MDRNMDRRPVRSSRSPRRGGENNFHGSAFYFGRNDALNAAEFFANRGGVGRDELSRKDFGGSLGGPIIKDRLFFFFSTEWNKEVRGKTRFGRVPTDAERTGDFSQSVTRPTCSLPAIGNGRPGTGTNIIPAASISPAGQALVQLFPRANQPFNESCHNWFESLPSPINFSEYNIRIDYNVTDKHKIFGRFTDDDWGNAFPIIAGGLWGDDAFPTVETAWSQPARQFALKLTSTLSNTAINEVQFSYSANRILVDPGNGGDINNNINTLVPGFFPDSAKVNGVDRPHPVFWGGIAPFFSSTGSDLWTTSPFRNALDIYSIRDDFSKVAGKHTIKAGFLFDSASKDEDSGPNNEAVQFWGTCPVTFGNYLADIDARNVYRIQRNRHDGRGRRPMEKSGVLFWRYLEDSANVTLELGHAIRSSMRRMMRVTGSPHLTRRAYDPSRPATDPCNGLLVPKGAGNICSGIPGATAPTEFSNRALRKNNYGNIAPRIGVAWDVFSNGKTAIRGGLGQFFLRERTSPVFAALTLNPPFRQTMGGHVLLDAPVVSAGLPSLCGAGSPARYIQSGGSNTLFMAVQHTGRSAAVERRRTRSRICRKPCPRPADQLRY